MAWVRNPFGFGDQQQVWPTVIREFAVTNEHSFTRKKLTVRELEALSSYVKKLFSDQEQQDLQGAWDSLVGFRVDPETFQRMKLLIQEEFAIKGKRLAVQADAGSRKSLHHGVVAEIQPPSASEVNADSSTVSDSDTEDSE